MELSTKNQKRKLRIAIIAFALVAVPIAFASINRGHSLGYELEQKRFAKVLKEASDEELFVVLNYAIAHHYVPNRDVDPYYDVNVMVGCWKRSLMVYNNLSGRKDLLRKIYPDLKVLDEYVNWGQRTGEPYPDTLVSKTIMDNAKKECQGIDNRMVSKYFDTPLMWD